MKKARNHPGAGEQPEGQSHCSGWRLGDGDGGTRMLAVPTGAGPAGLPLPASAASEGTGRRCLELPFGPPGWWLGMGEAGRTGLEPGSLGASESGWDVGGEGGPGGQCVVARRKETGVGALSCVLLPGAWLVGWGFFPPWGSVQVMAEGRGRGAEQHASSQGPPRALPGLGGQCLQPGHLDRKGS